MYSWAVPQGIFVCLVIPGSPAAMAGLRLDHLLHLFSSFRFIVSLNFCEYNYVEVWRPASHAWSNCPRRNDFRRRPLQVGFWPNISFFSSFSGFGVDQWTTLLWRWVFMGNFLYPLFSSRSPFYKGARPTHLPEYGASQGSCWQVSLSHLSSTLGLLPKKTFAWTSVLKITQWCCSFITEVLPTDNFSRLNIHICLDITLDNYAVAVLLSHWHQQCTDQTRNQDRARSRCCHCCRLLCCQEWPSHWAPHHR